MAPFPQRVPLPDQVAALLKEGILAARWQEELSSENQLCREFHVSRSTLRRGLDQLFREGWVAQGGRGRRHRILKVLGTASTPSTGSVVRVLFPGPLWVLGDLQQRALEIVGDQIAALGCRLAFERRPGLFERHQPEELERLTHLPDTVAWLLVYSTEAIQHWFASRGIPCLVVGPLYPGVALPGVYPDNAAAARHAAGLLHARGYREMVYLRALKTTLGDRVAEAAFLGEAVRLGAKARSLLHGAESSSIAKEVRGALVSHPRPSAFVSASSETCVTTLCNLLAAGFRFPGEMALISLWDDLVLSQTEPPVSRYRIDPDRLGKKIGSTLLGLIRHGAGECRAVAVVPEFVIGGTTGGLEIMDSSGPEFRMLRAE